MRQISVAPSTPIPPSFLISGAPTKVAPVLRLDQINSQLVIQAARRVLFEALDHCAPSADVCGVVLKANPANLQGRIVQAMLVLLPDEQFVPIELIRARRSRSGPSRLRFPRTNPSPTTV